uniref:Uncharacterized protein n=1 Tax=Chlorobium phaeobacteroides (strain BS1) TaxID=331678 RepID=B3END7_CHLPB
MDIVEITKENGKVFSFLEGQGDFSVSFSRGSLFILK